SRHRRFFDRSIRAGGRESRRAPPAERICLGGGLEPFRHDRSHRSAGRSHPVARRRAHDLPAGTRAVVHRPAHRNPHARTVAAQPRNDGTPRRGAWSRGTGRRPSRDVRIACHKDPAPSVLALRKELKMFTKVVYTTVFVSDQDKALDFYTKTLGFEKRADNPAPGGSRFLAVG